MDPKVIIGKTDSGGVLTKVFYLDKAHNMVDKDTATQVITEEYDKNGLMIMRTYLSPVEASNEQ